MSKQNPRAHGEPRRLPPRCEDCKHSASFHSNAEGHSCKALGCECEALVLAEGVQLPHPEPHPA
jgi:hypothetical protein